MPKTRNMLKMRRRRRGGNLPKEFLEKKTDIIDEEISPIKSNNSPNKLDDFFNNISETISTPPRGDQNPFKDEDDDYQDDVVLTPPRRMRNTRALNRESNRELNRLSFDNDKSVKNLFPDLDSDVDSDMEMDENIFVEKKIPRQGGRKMKYGRKTMKKRKTMRKTKRKSMRKRKFSRKN